MRICVAHETVYRYERPAKSVIQTLRLTPRSHDGQHVVRWRIDVDQDVRLSQSEDAFGNISHAFTAIGSIESLRVRVEGEVETHDNAGVLHGVVERFPVSLYLRDTGLTQADASIQDFASRSAAAAGGGLAACHALMQAIHDRVEVSRDPKQPAAGLIEALATGSGVAQDASHLFIACARSLGIPARYVSGLLWQPPAQQSSATHAWAEAYVEGLGWVGFDPALSVCPTIHHIRVAAGLDYLSAAPVRGAHYGGDGESLEVAIDIGEKGEHPQAQRQSQS
ncbi:transglutaminase family protein [Labrys sp. LIt4]|uniref:transglutaminase family protein n=1 Tax=Labrys sp. LIt4 TaxID=2821355 RepID=UPI001AE08AFF|nr:transglutaminase family protein [Labrys sp. LIt4]MBP0578807.1 transglutaminase family protein [Labrys sp. LIt4]